MLKALLKIFVIVLLFPFVVKGQPNLVPNPSFEQYDTCPNNGGQIHYAPPWSNPTPYATPDYFNGCGVSGYGTPNTFFGLQNAYSGNSFAGILTYWYDPINPAACQNRREYLQVPLLDSLLPGIKYCVRLYVRLADSAVYAANNLGVFFSDTLTSLPIDSVIPVNPQINNNPTSNPLTNKNGWTMVLDSFVASGGEQYMIIGNFNNDSNTDTANLTGANWFKYAFYLIDDILVTPCDSFNSTIENLNQSYFKIFPSPTSDFIHINWNYDTCKRIEVLNCLGQVLEVQNNLEGKTTLEIDLQNYPAGIYFIKFQFEQQFFQTKIIKE